MLQAMLLFVKVGRGEIDFFPALDTQVIPFPPSLYMQWGTLREVASQKITYTSTWGRYWLMKITPTNRAHLLWASLER